MSDSNDITVLNSGVYKNLLAQVEAIYKHSNELSFKTRARYFEATKRFCKFFISVLEFKDYCFILNYNLFDPHIMQTIWNGRIVFIFCPHETSPSNSNFLLLAEFIREKIHIIVLRQ